MTTAPQSSFVNSDADRQTKLIVRLGAAGGGAPTASDEVDYLVPGKITQVAGGRRLDSAQLTYVYEAQGETLTNLQTPVDWNREVEIWNCDDQGNPVQPLFWGELTEQTMELDDEHAEGTVANLAAVAPYHFGSPLDGVDVWDPVSSSVKRVPINLEFNPEIDLAIEGNRSSVLHPTHGYYLWTDPDSVRTSTAQAYSGQIVADWSLPIAIDTLCKFLNPDETYIKNPADPINDPLFADPPALRNVVLRRGFYLPQLLDEMLEPLGFTWYVALTVDSAGACERRIKIVKDGEGTTKSLKMQYPGATFHPRGSNTKRLTLESNIADLANQIVAHGEFQQREFTIELYRTWPEADDSLTGDDLDKSDKDSDYYQDDKQLVYRKFAANESGDYCDLRTSVDPIPSTALDLSSEFDLWIPRRRPFHDCLTRDEAGRRRKPFVEYSDDAGSTWQPCGEQWSIDLLDDELGVVFTDSQPPEEFLAAGDDLRVRITAVVQGDSRLTYETSATGDSPNSNDVVQLLDLSDRFVDRQIQTTGTYASELSQPFGADERDDSAAGTGELIDYVDRLQEIHQSVVQRGDFTIGRIDTGYDIGDLLDSVLGRNISLNRNAAGATPKVLQVRGRTWDFAAQTTTLHPIPVEDTLE